MSRVLKMSLFNIKDRFGFLSMVCVTAMGVSNATIVDNAALDNAKDGSNWPAFSRTFSEDRFSPLTQINDKTVSRLGLAWSLELPGFASTESNPLAVDGVLYFSVGLTVVHAVDARSGKLLWRYDAEVAKTAPRKMHYSWGSRGLAFWNGRIYVGTMDGRLIALDAKNGKQVWSVMTIDAADGRYITGAPRVFNGKVIMGHGGGDYGARGYVTAYDAESGRQLWRFYTVPGNPALGFENKTMEMAARTWHGEWWKHGGGGAVWNAMTYDPDFNRLYLGTGNGAPWNQKIRSPGGGDNLFLSSIVALDADTGEYVWHYQVNPGESWDFDSAMDMILATLDIDGKPRKVLMQAPKNGFFYVIDRETGRLISAEKFSKATWADKIDAATGRPVEATNIRYESGEVLIWPGPMGAHNRQPMAYSPLTRLAYIPTMQLPGYYNDKGIDLAHWESKPGEGTVGLNSTFADPPLDAGSSSLQAWDPVRQIPAWSVATPGVWNGGTIATAGNLVFQGQVDGKFNAYAADTGKLLWSFSAGNGIVAPPITYRVAGRQYVSVLTGVGGGASLVGSLTAQFGWEARIHRRRMLTFVLDGKSRLPPSPLPARAIPIDDPKFVVVPAKVKAGEEIFGAQCMTCHGPVAVAAGAAPDLRASGIPLEETGFSRIVRDGALQSRGMPAFTQLTDEDLAAIRHYIRYRAREDLGNQARP